MGCVLTCSIVPEGTELDCGLPEHIVEEEVILAQNERLLIRAIRQATDGDAFYQQLSIYVDSNLIYYDQEKLFNMHAGLLPIVRELEGARGQFEILLGFVGQYEYDRILQVIVDSTVVVRQDTFPMFAGMHKDIDEDGRIEFIGNWFPDLNYCFDCDSSYYNPPAIYEMNVQGFRYDSVAVKQWIEENYGVFEGYETNKYQIIPLISAEKQGFQ